MFGAGSGSAPEGDQQLFNVFAVVLLAGAAFAALTFSARTVEAQWREIGVAIALGDRPLSVCHHVAMRPLLVGIQIAVLGVVLGVGMGVLIGNLIGEATRGLLLCRYL